MRKVPARAAPPACDFPALPDRGWLAAATAIATSEGPIPAGWLRPGDLVVTHDRRLLPILALGRAELARAELADRPGLWPLRLSPGALGPGRPAVPLTVSPWQRVLVEGAALAALPGRRAALVEARHLIGWPGVDCEMPARTVLALQVVLDRHALLLADGLWTESLLVGPATLRVLRRDRPDPLPRLGTGHAGPALPILTEAEAARILPPPAGPDLAAAG